MRNCLYIWLSTLLLIFPKHEVSAQVNFKVNLSQKHLNKVEKAKNGRQKLKRYYKLYKKDSVKAARRYHKMMDRKLDSLHQVNRKRLLALGDSTVSAYDSVGLRSKSRAIAGTDSATVDSLRQIYVNDYLQNNYGTNLQYLEALQGRDSTQSLDSLVRTELTGQGETLAQGLMKNNELGGLQERHRQLLSQAEQFKGYSASPTDSLDEDQARRIAKKELMKQVMNQPAVKAAQLRMKKLKAKYSYLPNSNDLGTAIKRKSLKGQPFKKRLYLGGNFTINSTDPFIVDFTPQVGYRIDKKLIVGLAGTYRENFGQDSVTLTNGVNMDDAYGYSAFISYDLMKGFFAYGEQEQLRTKKLFRSSETYVSWKNATLIGLGRSFNFGPYVNGKTILLYNVTKNSLSNIYPRRWVVKIGFDLDRLAMGRK